jgi:spore coat protein CotF
MHDGERTLKQQLTQLTTHGDKIDALYTKLGYYHKEDVALQKKVKANADHVNLRKQK